MAEKLNLYQKIVEVRKQAGGFMKDSKSFNYEYVSGNQVLGKIKDIMNELNLLLIPSTTHQDEYKHEYLDKYGKEKLDFVVRGNMVYTWIDGDTGEKLEIPWTFYGQQNDISKAYGSALTYSERYFLLKCLGLPTDDDDPDGKDTTGKKTQPKKPAPKKSEPKPAPKKPEQKQAPKTAPKTEAKKDPEAEAEKPAGKKLNKTEVQTITALSKKAKVDPKIIMKEYDVNALEDLTKSDYTRVLGRLKKTLEKNAEK